MLRSMYNVSTAGESVSCGQRWAASKGKGNLLKVLGIKFPMSLPEGISRGWHRIASTGVTVPNSGPKSRAACLRQNVLVAHDGTLQKRHVSARSLIVRKESH